METCYNEATREEIFARRSSMRDRMRKFFTAVIFLLFLIILTIPAESQAAVRYNLIKDVTSQETPEGQLDAVWQERKDTFSVLADCLDRPVDQHRRQGSTILTRYGYADTGWITCQGNKYFLRASGALHQGGLLRIKGRMYLFRYGYGHLMTGWVTLKGEQILFPRDQQQRSHDP